MEVSEAYRRPHLGKAAISVGTGKKNMLFHSELQKTQQHPREVWGYVAASDNGRLRKREDRGVRGERW